MEISEDDIIDINKHNNEIYNKANKIAQLMTKKASGSNVIYGQNNNDNDSARFGFGLSIDDSKITSRNKIKRKSNKKIKKLRTFRKSKKKIEGFFIRNDKKTKLKKKKPKSKKIKNRKSRKKHG